ncbi:MAG: response regulator [Alphaproteobacteria bacterium]|nr:response regulator [Alphaproteobacteria bacterium]
MQINSIMAVQSISRHSSHKKNLDFTDDVIVIDDDEDDRHIMGHMIQDIDARQNVRFFSDSDTFLNHMQAQELLWNENRQLGLPKLILLDMQMPLKDGVQTIAAIRSDTHWRDVPVVIVTGINNDQKIAQAYEWDANAFLSKPFIRSDLAEIMFHEFNYTSTLI